MLIYRQCERGEARIDRCGGLRQGSLLLLTEFRRRATDGRPQESGVSITLIAAIRTTIGSGADAGIGDLAGVQAAPPIVKLARATYWTER